MNVQKQIDKNITEIDTIRAEKNSNRVSSSECYTTGVPNEIDFRSMCKSEAVTQKIFKNRRKYTHVHLRLNAGIIKEDTKFIILNRFNKQISKEVNNDLKWYDILLYTICGKECLQIRR